MLSDKEKKAIELLEDHLICGNKEGVLYRNLRIISRIIEKQSKEIEELKEEKAKRQWVHIKENGEVEPLFYVSEDKIKAKIEEYKEKCKNCNFRGKICKEFKQNYNCTIAMCLKEFYSLLEKE